MKQLTALWTFVMSALSVTARDEIVNEGQLKLSEEQEQTLVSSLGSQELFDQAMEALNRSIEAEAQENSSQAELEAIQKELKAFNAKFLQQAEAEADGGEPPKASDEVKQLLQAFKAQEKSIEKMMKETVGDSPLEIVRVGAEIAHSETHLFASGQPWDAIDANRPWNNRFLNFSSKATNFRDNETVITNLKDDVKDFILQHGDKLNSLFWDHDGLPSEWSYRSGVIDQIADGFIIPAEITQGRKPHWAPKNAFSITAEKGRVFPKQVDISFTGYDLQQIETTWLNKQYNNVGTHPWKMSFVYTLLEEIAKQIKKDSRVAQTKGIFVETPNIPGLAGANENSQDGLMYNWFYYRDIKKSYRPFAIGAPPMVGIVDWVDNMVQMLPEHVRNADGLEIQWAEKYTKAYQKEAGDLYRLQMSTDEGKKRYSKNHVIDYPNIIFQKIKDFNNTDFVGITFSKNVEVMEYDRNEKTRFTVTHHRRDTDIFADFREGIRFLYVGNKVMPGDPKEFELQYVWSNDVPVFPADRSIPLFNSETGIIEPHYKHLSVHDTLTRDIENIEDVKVGQVIKITGNKNLAGTPAVKKNTNLLLTSDFNLKEGGTLTLLVMSDGKLKEITRAAAEEPTTESVVEFTEEILDASAGSTFKFAGSATVAIAEIMNGVEDKEIQIFGTDTTDVDVTLSTKGNINVASAATLATADDNITLKLIEGTWYEIAREIA